MASTLGETIARYAARLQPALGEGHHVGSALGAWLVLALAAPASTGSDREQLEAALGEPAGRAAELARGLLAEPHPAVAAAVALWSAATGHSTGWDAWLAHLGRGVEVGPMPSPAEADAWVEKHTLGLVKALPVRLSPDVLLALVSALATKVSWQIPFAVAPAAELGGDWGVRRVLRSQASHRCLIVADPELGDVAVHVTESGAAGTGLGVVSVLAAAGVPPSAVLAAAHRVALSSDEPERRSLFDLPLGAGHGWKISEEPGQGEQVSAVLPAWSATSTHDLLGDPRTGFAAAGRAIGALLDAPAQQSAGVQQAVARYSRFGFEAAAVTLLARKTALPLGGTRRVALLKFNRPYAAVAVARSSDPDGSTGPWHGVPVFSAWVARADEVEEAA